MKKLIAVALACLIPLCARGQDYDCPMDMGAPEPLYVLMAHINPMEWKIPALAPPKAGTSLAKLGADLVALKKKYEAFHDSIYQQELRLSEEERKMLAEEVLSMMGLFAQKAAQMVDQNKGATIESNDQAIKKGFSDLMKQMARSILSQSETLRSTEKITSELLKLPTFGKAIVDSFKEQYRFNKKTLHKNICAFLEKEAEVCNIGEERTAPKTTSEERKKRADAIQSSLSVFHESFDRKLRKESLQLERKLGAWKPGDRMKSGWAKLTGQNRPKIDWTKLDFENDVAPLLKLCGVQKALEAVDKNRDKRLSAGLVPPASYSEDCQRFFCGQPGLLPKPERSSGTDACSFVLKYPKMRAGYDRGFTDWVKDQNATPGYNRNPFCPEAGQGRAPVEHGTHKKQ